MDKEKEGIFSYNVIIIIFGLVLVFSTIGIVLAQTQPYSTYQNPNMGISFQYPSVWELTHNGPNTSNHMCFSNDICNVFFAIADPDIKVYGIDIRLTKLDDPQNGCSCNVLKDYVAWDYEKNFKDAKFIYDNQTTIGNKIPAWQMVIDQTADMTNPLSLRYYAVWAVNENYGYKFSYFAVADDQFDRYLDGFKKILNTVAFAHIEPPKKPSFMQSSFMQSDIPN